MTRAEIRTRVLQTLNESATAPVFWSADQVNDSIDEGAEVLAEEALAIRRTAFVPLKAGWMYYSTRGIAPDVMAVYRLWLAHLHIHPRLDPVSIAELDARHRRWGNVPGIPHKWFSLSWDTFGIWPVPASAGGILRVDYYAWPRALMDDDDEPEFPVADHEALVAYGYYDGLLKEWDAAGAGKAFVLFADRLGTGRARVGIREMQARTFRSAAADGGTLRGH